MLRAMKNNDKAKYLPYTFINLMRVEIASGNVEVRDLDEILQCLYRYRGSVVASFVLLKIRVVWKKNSILRKEIFRHNYGE
jgi:hypothetical protein